MISVLGGLTDLDVGETSTKIANITLNGNSYKISNKVFELVTLNTSDFTYSASSSGTGTSLNLTLTLKSTAGNIYCIESVTYRVSYYDSAPSGSHSTEASGTKTNVTALTRNRTVAIPIVSGTSGHNYSNISITSISISGYMFNIL